MSNTLAQAINSLETHAYPNMIEAERRFVDELPPDDVIASCPAVVREHVPGIIALLGRYRDVVPDASQLMQELELTR